MSTGNSASCTAVTSPFTHPPHALPLPLIELLDAVAIRCGYEVERCEYGTHPGHPARVAFGDESVLAVFVRPK